MIEPVCWLREEWLHYEQAAEGDPGAFPVYHANLPSAFPQAHRLAMELECLLLACTDTCATATWWESANEALEQWREFCREDSTHNA